VRNIFQKAEVYQTLHDVRCSPALVHYMYIFGGFCPLTEFCQVQNSLCVQVLCSHCTALEQRALTKLRRGTRNGIMELLQRVPPILGRAAITLGRGPRSSCLCFVRFIFLQYRCKWLVGTNVSEMTPPFPQIDIV